MNIKKLLYSAGEQQRTTSMLTGVNTAFNTSFNTMFTTNKTTTGNTMITTTWNTAVPAPAVNTEYTTYFTTYRNTNIIAGSCVSDPFVGGDALPGTSKYMITERYLNAAGHYPQSTVYNKLNGYVNKISLLMFNGVTDGIAKSVDYLFSLTSNVTLSDGTVIYHSDINNTQIDNLSLLCRSSVNVPLDNIEPSDTVITYRTISGTIATVNANETFSPAPGTVAPGYSARQIRTDAYKNLYTINPGGYLSIPTSGTMTGDKGGHISWTNRTTVVIGNGSFRFDGYKTCSINTSYNTNKVTLYQTLSSTPTTISTSTTTNATTTWTTVSDIINRNTTLTTNTITSQVTEWITKF